MNGIFWLASYPKSGNTWMRVFLTNYWRDSDIPADINELERTPIASAREIFEDQTGVCTSELSLDEIDGLRPAVYRRVAQQTQEPLFCKIHDAYTRLPGGTPMFPPDAARGAVYIIRNPLDVAVSYANHNNCSVAHSVEMMCDDSHVLCGNTRSQPNQLRQRLLSWSSHVRSWVETPEMPVHVTRYEDMKDDPEKAFTEVVRFIGGEMDRRRICKAIEFASFENLKNQEQEHGFREKMALSPTFFRKGVVGSWRESLTDEQKALIVTQHRDVMRNFGYLTEYDELVY